MLYETQNRGKTTKVPQKYTNPLLFGGKPATGDVSYKITKPEPYTGSILLDKNTGTLTFQNTPETITVEATYAGKTATYTFTVTDHFSGRNTHSSVAIGSDMYVIGGHNGSNRLNDVWKSSNGGQTWSKVDTGTIAAKTLFSARNGHSSVAISSGPYAGIYVIGGYDGTNYFNDVWKSSNGGQTWTQVATGTIAAKTLFSARSAHSSVAVGSDMYVIGGHNRSNRLNDVWKSTNGGQTWSKVDTGTTGANTPFSTRNGHSSVAIGSDIYVIGGVGGVSFFNDVWKSTNGGQTWSKVDTGTIAAKTLFPGRNTHSSVAIGSDMYVIGGFAGGKNNLNDVWKSSNGGQTWSKVNTGSTGANTLFSARSAHSSVAIGSNIYVIGGDNTTNYFNDVWKSTDGGVTWENVHATP